MGGGGNGNRRAIRPLSDRGVVLPMEVRGQGRLGGGRRKHLVPLTAQVGSIV